MFLLVLVEEYKVSLHGSERIGLRIVFAGGVYADYDEFSGVNDNCSKVNKCFSSASRGSQRLVSKSELL